MLSKPEKREFFDFDNIGISTSYFGMTAQAGKSIRLIPHSMGKRNTTVTVIQMAQAKSSTDPTLAICPRPIQPEL